MTDDDEDSRNCTVCGDPVMWGSRHHQWGSAVLASEREIARLTTIIDRHIKILRRQGSIHTETLAALLQQEVHGKPWEACKHLSVHRMTRVGAADDRYGCDAAEC